MTRGFKMIMGGPRRDACAAATGSAAFGRPSGPRYAAGLAHAPAQLIAVLTATSNWFAARLQNIPPLLTAATTRSRTSIE